MFTFIRNQIIIGVDGAEGGVERLGRRRRSVRYSEGGERFVLLMGSNISNIPWRQSLSVTIPVSAPGGVVGSVVLIGCVHLQL